MKNFKVGMIGRAGVITAKITTGELARAIKMLPNIAKVNDGKNDIFVVSVGAKESLSKYGIQFALTDETKDLPASVTFETTKAVMTREEVIEELGVNMIYLDKIIGQYKAQIGALTNELNGFFDDDEEVETPIVDEDVIPAEPVMEQMTLDDVVTE